MATVYQDMSYKAGDDLRIGVGTKTSNVLPTTATAYKRGDLLVIDSATNVATHSTDGTDWHVICAEDVSSEQATNHVSDGIEIPVYVAGEFNAFECKINGTKLNKDQRLKARGRATNAGLSIILKMPAGIEDK